VNTSTRIFRVVLEWDPEGLVWTVSVPALPGCLTQGPTREEALRRVSEAIACHLEGLRADGLPIPDDVPVELDSVAVAV
jgi:predicted RNase H-like HicB family nuclease